VRSLAPARPTTGRPGRGRVRSSVGSAGRPGAGCCPTAIGGGRGHEWRLKVAVLGADQGTTESRLSSRSRASALRTSLLRRRQNSRKTVATKRRLWADFSEIGRCSAEKSAGRPVKLHNRSAHWWDWVADISRCLAVPSVPCGHSAIPKRQTSLTVMETRSHPKPCNQARVGLFLWHELRRGRWKPGAVQDDAPNSCARRRAWR
jgi:hypothetical protein